MPSYSLLFMVVKAYLNTIGESMESDSRHAVGDRDRGQAAAIRESASSYARHAVLRPVVCD